jgi:CBS domain containing-hemolysin-like protein
MSNNVSLALTKPKPDIGFLMQADARNILLDLKDPALNLLTDFYLTPAISVLVTTQIDNALTQMICSGVRLLFVVDPGFTLLGVITSYDIQGEKPLRYLQSRDCRIGICSREDILVQDIMTPLHKWRVVDYEQLRHARVADVVEAFKELGQRHLIVVDEAKDDAGRQVVRGLISLTTLERALGTPVASTKVADSFAEIKSELVT